MTKTPTATSVLGDVRDLADFLNSRGYRVSMGDELRIERLSSLLEMVGAREAGGLADVLAPVVARTPEDQERLPGVLAEFAARQTGSELPVQSITKFEQTAKAGERHRKRLTTVLIIILLAIVTTLLAYFFWPDPQVGGGNAADKLGRAYKKGQELGWPSWLFVAAPLIVGVAVILYRRRMDPLLRGRRPRDPEAVARQIPPEASKLLARRHLGAAVRRLRRHRFVPSADLDVARTVAATIRRAGFIELVRANRAVLPEYVLLIDRAHARDHVGSLADVLWSRLRAEQLRTIWAEYDGDPRRLRIRQNASERRASLDELAQENHEAQLILFADAATLWDFNKSTWRKWTSGFDQFRAVAILTPVPRSRWSFVEQMLMQARGYALAPATSEGLSEFAELLQRSELGVPGPPRGGAARDALNDLLTIDPLLWHDDDPPPGELRTALMTALRQHLGRSAFLQLCATAVYPAVHPRLTEEVARAVAVVNGNGAARTDGEPIEEDYAAISRLPWLRLGKIPGWLRSDLVEAMPSSEAPGIRAVWTNALQPIPLGEMPPSSDQVAQASTENDATRRALLRLIQSDESLPMNDVILTSFLQGQSKSVEDPSVRRPVAVRSRPFDRVDLVSVGVALTSAVLLTASLPFVSPTDVAQESDTPTNEPGSQAGGTMPSTGNGNFATADSSVSGPPTDLNAADVNAAEESIVDGSTVDGSTIDESTVDGSTIDESTIDESTFLDTCTYNCPDEYTPDTAVPEQPPNPYGSKADSPTTQSSTTRLKNPSLGIPKSDPPVEKLRPRVSRPENSPPDPEQNSVPKTE